MIFDETVPRVARLRGPNDSSGGIKSANGRLSEKRFRRAEKHKIVRLISGFVKLIAVSPPLRTGHEVFRVEVHPRKEFR